MLTPRSLSVYGRYTFRKQLPAEILLGTGLETAMQGIALLVRLFQPSDLAVTLLFVIHHTLFLTAPYVSERLRCLPTRRGFELAFLIGVPALLCAYFVEGFWGLGPLLVLANFAFVTVTVPPRNRMMRANYHATERGHCYGRSKSIASSMFFGFALLGALRLTENRDDIYWMLPIVGISAGLGLLLYRGIRVRHEATAIAAARERASDGFFGTYRSLFRLFVENRTFMLFEIGFMIYGFAFMMTLPREMHAVGTVLKASPVMIVLAIYGIAPVTKLLCVSLFGRMLDRRGPTGTAAIAFGLLALFPLLVWAAVTSGSVTVWLISRAAFGLAMAGVDVCWSIGPIHYGGRENAAAYTAAHIFAVGVRASIFPIVGQLLFGLIGFGVFGFSALILVGAALFMRSQSSEPDPAPG